MLRKFVECFDCYDEHDEEQKARRAQLFRSFDTNGNSYISLAEVGRPFATIALRDHRPARPMPFPGVHSRSWRSAAMHGLVSCPSSPIPYAPTPCVASYRQVGAGVMSTLANQHRKDCERRHQATLGD